MAIASLCKGIRHRSSVSSAILPCRGTLRAGLMSLAYCLRTPTNQPGRPAPMPGLVLCSDSAAGFSLAPVATEQSEERILIMNANVFN
jgi:hypothetical protein